MPPIANKTVAPSIANATTANSAGYEFGLLFSDIAPTSLINIGIIILSSEKFMSSLDFNAIL